MQVSVENYIKQGRRGTLRWRHPLCPLCHRVIKPNTEADGPQYIVIRGKHRRVHAGCYFDSLGKLVEEHPIGVPHGHGPHGCVAGN